MGIAEGLRWQYGSAGKYTDGQGNATLNTGYSSSKQYRRLYDYGPEKTPDVIFRLKEGIERFAITDINNPAAGMRAQSEYPVMFDGWTQDRKVGEDAGGSNINKSGIEVFNHVPGGSNVLYMDGHVEFVRYQGLSGKYPVRNGAGNDADYSAKLCGAGYKFSTALADGIWE